MAATAPDLLIVGPVTWDLFGVERRPGGAVQFAARVAASMGVRAAVLTVAAPDADLAALEGHEVHIVPAESALTFEHREVDGQRQLRVETGAEPPTLRASDVPVPWLDAPDVILAPLLPTDLDVASFANPSGHIALFAQGVQRCAQADGVIQEATAPSDPLIRAITPECTVFLSDAELANWPTGRLEDLVARARRVVVTRGSAGATVYRGGERFEVPASPADVVDTTGAGDVFATAFILAVSRLGLEDREAARLASAYAAASIERVGPAELPPLSEIVRRAGLATGSVDA